MIASTLLAAALALHSSASDAAPAVEPAPAVVPSELTQENRAVIRCSAAFAMIAHGQSVGNEDALKWPELGARGREFFVVSLAGVMDDTGLNREGVSQLVGAEAQRLWDSGDVDAVMPACLLMLETSGV